MWGPFLLPPPCPQAYSSRFLPSDQTVHHSARILQEFLLHDTISLVFISQRYHRKCHTLGGLGNGHSLSQSLEASSPRSRGWWIPSGLWGRVYSRRVSWLLAFAGTLWHSSSSRGITALSAFIVTWGHVCVRISSLWQDISRIGLGPI